MLLGLGWKPLRILDEAARIEGHPDNVAACVLGSIVASAIDSAGVARAVRIELPSATDIGVVVPDFALPTSKPAPCCRDCYSRADAIFNVQRAALLVAALATGTTAPFPPRSKTACISPIARARARPDDILKLRAPGLLGCALSGAGPWCSCSTNAGCEQVCDCVRADFRPATAIVRNDAVRPWPTRTALHIEEDNEPWT